MSSIRKTDAWVVENGHKIPKWDFIARDAGLTKWEAQMLHAAGYLQAVGKVRLDWDMVNLWRASGKLRAACASD